MKTFRSLMFVVLVLMCMSCQGTEAAIQYSGKEIVVQRVSGDKLPAYANGLSEVDVGDSTADGLMISNDLVDQAFDDPILRSWLKEVSYHTVLLIPQGNMKRVIQMLEAKKTLSGSLIGKSNSIAVIRLKNRTSEDDLVLTGWLVLDRENYSADYLQDKITELQNVIGE